MHSTGTPLVDWVNERVPGLSVVSASEPAPVLLAENLIAVSGDPEQARSVMRDWERIEYADGAVGLVVMSRTDDPQPAPAQADPERVVAHAGRRIVIGAVPGALIGAAVVGVLAGLLTGWGAAVVGAALGGAAFGAIAGAVWSFVAGTGWSKAYTEGFVPPETADVVIASIHSQTPGSIDEAIRATSPKEGVELYRVDSSGGAVRVRHP